MCTFTLPKQKQNHKQTNTKYISLRIREKYKQKIQNKNLILHPEVKTNCDGKKSSYTYNHVEIYLLQHVHRNTCRPPPIPKPVIKTMKTL